MLAQLFGITAVAYKKICNRTSKNQKNCGLNLVLAGYSTHKEGFRAKVPGELAFLEVI